MQFYQSTNATDLDSSHYNLSSNICPPLHVTPLIVTAGLVSCGIIVGNSLVIIAIVGGNAKFFRPMYWFIIHLSSSDLSVGFMLLWNYCLAAIFNINNTLISLSVLQAVWVTSSCSSVLGILMLAVDRGLLCITFHLANRYMQVVHNRLHRRYFNQLTVGIAIFFAWLVPILLFLVAPIAFNWSCKENCRCHHDVGHYIDCLPFEKCSQVVPPFTKSYILVGVIYLFFLMPWPILVYSLIFIKARRSTQALPGRRRRRDFRLIRTLVVIMITFIVTFTPAGVVMILDYSSVSGGNSELVDYALYAFTASTINSLLNPVLYIWRIPAIRLSLEQRFRCCRKAKLSSTESRRLQNEKRMHSHVNSEQGMHSDIPISPQTPLDDTSNHRSAFIFCGKRFSSNFSDVSQNSTPASQRSTKKTMAMKLQTLSVERRSRTSSQSPGTSNNRSDDVESGALVAKEPFVSNGTDRDAATFPILFHRRTKHGNEKEIFLSSAAS